ncbi:sphinganine C4-monooxygenase 1-like [Durio zibethinus]|uniref:Sphinganine C4-monooxygenase 1-like n=1 Tax=Durio zibethinus TaxID=66656 RepID=A0A6P6BFQ8_DURZI|nr:sphinganine C4-monooxygenase 1-like [Durio zibethinus]
MAIKTALQVLSMSKWGKNILALEEIKTTLIPFLILNLTLQRAIKFKIVMALATSEELQAILVPIVVYWTYSGMYVILESWCENYKLHSKQEEEEKNLVSRKTVIKGVLLHQTIQATLNFLVLMVTGGNDAEASPRQPSSLIIIAKQLVIAMVFIDTWSYFIHRYLHYNKFLYRHLHAPHHRIVVSYAFGAQYMHPLEGILDTMGGSLSIIVSGMSPRTSMFFFSFALIKLVDDHCGMRLPGNPFYIFFKNNSAYHDIHHQLYGAKYNFSVYFVTWDKILGTYMPYSLEKKAEGGFEVRRADQEHKDD